MAALQRKSGVLVAASCAMVLALTGCSGDSGGDETPSGAPSAAVSGQPQQPSVAPTPTLADEVGAVKDAKVDSCQAGDGGWVAKGTVTNPTPDPVDYLVVVSLQDQDRPAGNQTAGVNWTLVEGVAGNATQNWEVTIGATPTNATCVLRVTRSAAGARATS